MQFFPADLLSGTLHLTTEQIGAYLMLLFAMWTAGGSLINEPAKLARIARVSRQRWERISPDILPFFEVEGDQLTQERLKRDLEKVVSIVEKRSAAGKLGNAAKSLKQTNTDSANAAAKGERSERISEPYPEPEPEEGKSSILQPGLIEGHQPSQETAAPSKARRKPQLPLSEDWKLSDELWRYGTSLGLTGEEIGEEEINLRLWCRQNDHRCVDRDAFVQRWLRNATSRPRRGHQSSGRLPSRAESAIAGMFSRLSPEDFE